LASEFQADAILLGVSRVVWADLAVAKRTEKYEKKKRLDKMGEIDQI
jgi:hypothetical protein